MGGTADLAMIRELFLDMIAAEKNLEKRPSFPSILGKSIGEFISVPSE